MRAIALLLALLAPAAHAQLAHELTCDYFVPDGQGGFTPGRCVPVGTINPGASPTTGHVLTVQSDGSVAAAAATGGVSAADVADSFIAATYSGNTLTLTRRSGTNPFTATISGGGTADGVVTGATFNATNEVLTLTRSVGAPVTVDLSDIATDTEVSTLITAGLNGRLASAAPQNVVTGTGSVGVSTNFAREDHVHGGDRVGQAGSGLQAVATDATLTGDGTSGDPLMVANPFEAADETKLDGIATGANVAAAWALATGASGTAPAARLPGFVVHRENQSTPYDSTNGVIAFSVPGTVTNGDLIIFDAPANLGSDSGVLLSVNINGAGNRNLIDREENRINETHLVASAFYIIQADSSSYAVLTSLEDVASWAQATGASGTAPVARLGTGSPSTTNFLRGDGAWATPANSFGTLQPATVGIGTGSPGNSAFASRQDHDHVIAGTVQNRLLPTSPGDNQIAQYDAATSSWEAVNATGGTTTFTGLTDTPGTIVATQCVQGNAGGTALVFGACAGTGQTDGVVSALNYSGGTLTATRTSSLGALTAIILPYRTGSAFPTVTAADNNLLFEFNASVNPITNAVDFDGSTAVTSAARGDVFKYDHSNTHWVKQSARTADTVRGQFTGTPDTVAADAGDAGTSGLGARGDHDHGLDATVTARLAPATIVADQCVMGNSAGDALEFGACGTGGGTGDITSITTPTGSGIGLTGCDTGDCTIALDIPGMTSVGLNLLTSADEFILLESNLHRRTTLGNLVSYTFGQIVDQTDLAALADADSFVANDASEGSDDPREVSAARVSNYVGSRIAGAGLTYNATTNQIDASAVAQIELLDSLNDVTYTQDETADLSSRFGTGATVYVADLDADGTADASINDLFVFQWRDNPSSVPDDRALGIRVNDTGTTLPIRIVDPLTNSLTNKTTADLTRYEFLFLSRQDGVFIQLAGLALAEVMGRLPPTGGTAGQVLAKDTATDFDFSWTTISGTGTGDITAVTTSATSGLGGGADSGAAALTTDWTRLPAFDSSSEDTAAADDTINVYVDDFGGQQRMSISTFASEYSLGGAGSSTFVGLSDTPGNFTNAAGQLLRVNATANSVEFFPEPTNQNTIPHVGRIPAVTATSPDLIFLTHDEIDGVRDDAQLTIGRDAGNSCGYSDGSVYSPAFGAINEPSPVTSIFGIWNATDSNCDLSEVYTTNEGWLDDQSTIQGTAGGTVFTCNLGIRLQRNGQFAKRFTSCPALENRALNENIAINFFTADATPEPYWTDGSITNPAGLYEEVGTPRAYHDIRPIEESHRRGMGSAACGDSEAPDDGGQVCIDDEGRASFSTDAVALNTVEPEITDMTEFMSDYWQGASNNIVGFNNTGENGEFKWYTAGDNFFQIQGTRAQGSITVSGTSGTVIPEGTIFDRDGVSTTLIRTLADATIGAGGTVIITVEAVSPGLTGNNIPPTATFTLEDPITGVNDSAIIQTGFTGGTGSGLVGAFWETIWTYIAMIDDGDSAADQALHESLRDNSVFLGEFSQTQDAAEDRDGFTEDTDRYFYLIHGEEDHIQEVTGFTDGEAITEAFHEWRGPVVTIEDVHNVFEPNSGEAVTGGLEDFRVGDNVYSAIVRPDPATGQLRAPRASDFDTNIGRSRVLGFDGLTLQSVGRTLIAGHGATATDGIIEDGHEVSLGGHMWRYRDEHHGDSNVHNERDRDWYFDLYSNKMRVCLTSSAFVDCSWRDVNAHDVLATHYNLVGYFVNRADALAHLTANNQSAVYRTAAGNAASSFAFNRFTDVVVAVPAQYNYHWDSVVHNNQARPLPDPVADDQIARFDAASGTWQAEQFTTGEALTGIGTVADPLNVDVHDIIEDLAESVRWHTDSASHTEKGATVCNIFNTGPHRYVVTHTRWNINIPPSESHHYAARIYRLVTNSNEIAAKLGDSAVRNFSIPGTGHYLYFDSSGVVVPGSTRVAICLSRTVGGASSATFASVGPPDATSPTSTYSQDDTEEDWVRLGWTEYEALDPQIGMGTRTHDTDGEDNNDIYGEMQINFRKIINHGALLGGGNVDYDHLAEDVKARFCEVHTTYDANATYTSCDSVVLTQMQYDAIATPVAGVIYKIRAPNP